jgi:hypothetical protein
MDLSGVWVDMVRRLIALSCSPGLGDDQGGSMVCHTSVSCSFPIPANQVAERLQARDQRKHRMCIHQVCEIGMICMRCPDLRRKSGQQSFQRVTSKST